MSKINSETSFLYELFKENLNFIVFKLCKVINLYFFYLFRYTKLQINSLKAFPVSKINSKTSFLSQLFKVNSYHAGCYRSQKHSMVCALGKSEHAEPKVIGLRNHQNKLKFSPNYFKINISKPPNVQIQFWDKFSSSTFRVEFKYHTFKAMQGYY